MDERWFLFIGIILLIVVYVDGGVCGNANLEEGETCDVNRLNGENCTNFNYTGGSLSCLDDCSGYDFNQCTGEEVCGNGIIGGDELCEQGNVRGRTCEDEGYEGGTLKCSSTCRKYDYSECTGIKSLCGDENATGSEECDGSDMKNKTCSDEGFDFGDLRCDECRLNTEYCFNEDVAQNETFVNETVEENKTLEGSSGVVGSSSNVDKFDFGLSLSIWLIVFVGVLSIGIFFIWLFVFKIKK